MGTTAPKEPVTSPAPARRDQRSWVDVTAATAVAVAVALVAPAVSSIHPIIPVAITPALTALITVAGRRLLTRDPEEQEAAEWDDAPPPSRRPPPLLHGGWIVALVAAVLAFVTAVVLVTVLDVARGRGLDESTLVGDRVEIPTVAGQAGSEASKVIQAAGLVAEPVRREYSAGVPKFRVIRTDPEAGTSVRKGSSVTLVVSDGPRPVPRLQIPELDGKRLDEAVRVLDGLGLGVEAPDTGGSPQIVTEVDPDAGSVVAAGSTVRLLARPAVAVPSLEELTQAEAVRALEAAGLRARVNPVGQEGGVPGTVLGSEPAEGSEVAQGSTVTLEVAAVPIADVAGQSEDQALDQLRALGFEVTATTESSATVGTGLVIRTEPAARTPHTGPVQLVVSAGPPDA